MRRRTFLASSAAAALTASIGNTQGKPAAEGIFPSPHPVRIVSPVKPGPTVKSRYKKYNRDAVLAKMKTNERYDKLLENARGSVKQIVAMSESQLRGLIPPANTKRALMVHRKGCPVHGGGVAVYQPFGQSPDLSLPLQVKCPIGGEIYPNKDFPDDGQGWLDNRPDSPTKGERYYFVGWFNQWFLNSLPGRIKSLAQLSFLTGEEQYSRTAQILLKRFMEVYPDIDGNDLTYDGTDWGVYIKMTATMWEGSALMNLVRSVELLLPTLSDDFVKDFHAKVIRPAFEAYRAKPAPSNWGNVWNPPFAKFADVTGDREILDYLLWEHPVAAAPVLDNQYFRDGFPYEAAFSYGSHYLNDSQNIARELGVNGNWIWEHPNMRAAFPAYADLVCLDRFTHYFGDTGGLVNRGLTLSTGPLEEAWLRYRTPKLARYLLQAYAVNGTRSSVSLDTLFEEEKKKPNPAELKSFAAKEPPLRCTLSPVRGFAIMRTGEGDTRTELFLDYGYAHAAHSHADRLNINIFAAGREFIPEMGYPEYMDSIAPSPGGWTTHTVCHATVEVDEKRQLEGVFGDLHAFVEAEGLKYVDVSCEDAYVHCGVKLYRRSLALIDIPGGAYTVDIFRVRGGRRHDYLFHSMPRDVELDGPKLSEPRKGTLLGENVEFGYKHPDVLPYHVDNPGYQYLFDVQTCDMSAPYTARWKAEDGVAFSAVFVPDKSETFMLTKGYPRPSSKNLPAMPFLVRRNDPSGPEDLSTFAAVLSVEKTNPYILEVKRVALSSGDPEAYGVLIRHTWGEDLVLSTTSVTGRAVSADGRFSLTGQFGVASWRNGKLERLTLAGGTNFTVDGSTVQLAAPESRAVIRQVYDNRLVLDKGIPSSVAATPVFAVRKPVQSAYWVESVRGTTLSVAPGTWIGRGRVDRYDAGKGIIYDSRDIFPLGEKRNRLADITGMKFPEGNRNYYAGAWLVSEDGKARYRLTSGGFPGFVLDPAQDLSRVAADFPKGKTFLLYDLGPGDTLRALNWKQEKK